MQSPDISNKAKDPETGGFYNILAYRKLSKHEIVSSISHYLSQKNTEKPKNGKIVTILTSYH